MGKKIYVGNIPFRATPEGLKELFSGFGEVESVNIITDPQSGRSKGFGFVLMTTEEAAMKAIDGLNESLYMERALTVAEAKPPQPREGRDRR
ncbi:MAG: RNA-binding protein [Thermodesulfovibrionales bacterium]|jgi:RNA recognition motif-containing protein